MPSPVPLARLLVQLEISLQDACFPPQLLHDRSHLVETGGIGVVGERRGTNREEPIEEVGAHDLFEIAEVAEIERVGARVGFEDREGAHLFLRWCVRGGLRW